MTRGTSAKRDEGFPCCFIHGLSDDNFSAPDKACFPSRLRQAPLQKEKHDKTMGIFQSDVVANLSEQARAYLASLAIHDLDSDHVTAVLVWWMHALAVSCSPAYLLANSDRVRRDWPRVPLPRTKNALLASAALGCRFAALLDTEKTVEGVTTGEIDVRLREIGVIWRVGGETLDVYLNQHAYWSNIPKAVWEHRIGGYQVAKK